LALQQPGHEDALQTQLPPWQCKPGPQAGFAPQRQVAPGQLSVVAGGHAVHAEPLVPQVVVVRG
jgi:hypothetical protein